MMVLLCSMLIISQCLSIAERQCFQFEVIALEAHSLCCFLGGMSFSASMRGASFSLRLFLCLCKHSQIVPLDMKHSICIAAEHSVVANQQSL